MVELEATQEECSSCTTIRAHGKCHATGICIKKWVETSVWRAHFWCHRAGSITSVITPASVHVAMDLRGPRPCRVSKAWPGVALALFDLTLWPSMPLLMPRALHMPGSKACSAWNCTGGSRPRQEFDETSFAVAWYGNQFNKVGRRFGFAIQHPFAAKCCKAKNKNKLPGSTRNHSNICGWKQRKLSNSGKN